MLDHQNLLDKCRFYLDYKLHYNCKYLYNKIQNNLFQSNPIYNNNVLYSILHLMNNYLDNFK